MIDAPDPRVPFGKCAFHDAYLTDKRLVHILVAFA